MPAVMGIIADRYIQAQRLLGLCHALAAIFMLSAGYYGLQAGMNPDFATLFTLYTLSVAFYMPTIALSNSVAYTVLRNAGYDTVKAFPADSGVGTVGFICAMLFVDYIGVQRMHSSSLPAAVWASCWPCTPLRSPNAQSTGPANGNRWPRL